MQRDVEVAVERVQIAEPSGVQVRGVAHHGEGAREEPARRDEAGHLGDSGRGEKAREVREVVVIRDGLKSGHRIERASKEPGELAVAEATRLKVEAAQRPFHPTHPLFERVEAWMRGRAATTFGRAVLRHDDVEAAVEDASRPRELIQQPAVAVAQRHLSRVGALGRLL